MNELITISLIFLQISITHIICSFTALRSVVYSSVYRRHRRRSSVNFRGGGKTFMPEKYVSIINKIPEFYTIFARKCQTELLHNNCLKYIFPNFGGTCSPSPLPRLLRFFVRIVSIYHPRSEGGSVFSTVCL